MKKFLIAAVSALVLPIAASASSINLSAAVVSVNKSVAVTNNGTYGAAAIRSAFTTSATPCFGGACGDPIGCPSSPENPTALLGILGASGLLLGRIGYGRLRSRRLLSATPA